MRKGGARNYESGVNVQGKSEGEKRNRRKTSIKKCFAKGRKVVEETLSNFLAPVFIIIIFFLINCFFLGGGTYGHCRLSGSLWSPSVRRLPIWLSGVN
jgi:hypothetical protein